MVLPIVLSSLRRPNTKSTGRVGRRADSAAGGGAEGHGRAARQPGSSQV